MYAFDLEEYKNGEQDTKCLRTVLVWQVILLVNGGRGNPKDFRASNLRVADDAYLLEARLHAKNCSCH